MKTYRIGLKHDNGTAEIGVQANSIQEAKKLIMELEKFPESAMTYWAVVPTKKQIARTKSLLRGI